MSHEPAEHRHRHADPTRPADEAPTGAGQPRTDAPVVAPAPGPLSRRELRERERQRAADAAGGGGAASTASDEPALDEPAPGMADTVPSDTSRYALLHYLVLALVACVLGFLIWSLTTGAAEPGSSSAGPAVPTLSPSAPTTATQGEL